MNSFASSEISSKSESGKSNSIVAIFLMVSGSLSPVNGRHALKSAYASTPKLQMSLASVMGSKFSTSGAGKEERIMLSHVL